MIRAYIGKYKAHILFLVLIGMIFCGSVGAASLKDAGNKAKEAGAGMGYKQETSIESMIGTVIQTILSFLGVIFLGLTIYGGFLWMTAGGSEEQIGKAKKMIRNAVIGIAIVLAAYIITRFVTDVLSEQSGVQL